MRALQLIADTTCVRRGAALAARLSHPHPYVRVTAATALGERFALVAADSAARAIVVDSLTAHLSDRDARHARGGGALAAGGARSGGAAAGRSAAARHLDRHAHRRDRRLAGPRASSGSQLDLLAPRLDPQAPLAERLTAADVIGAPAGVPGRRAAAGRARR